MSRVSPAEGDLPVSKRDQAMVGDGHAMSVSAQILQHVSGAAEGAFGVDHPVLANRIQLRRKGFGWGERGEVSMEVQWAIL